MMRTVIKSGKIRHKWRVHSKAAIQTHRMNE